VKVYHDWEFLASGNKVVPISVGMVREDGEELYAEFYLGSRLWSKIEENPWLCENVMPLLQQRQHTYLEIRESVKKFFEVPDLELWGWYSAYDHMCLGQLFGGMLNLPRRAFWTNDIRQELHRLGEKAPRIPDLREPHEKQHFALDDARVEARMHRWLISYELCL
jgi:hypothetical protein